MYADSNEDWWPGQTMAGMPNDVAPVESDTSFCWSADWECWFVGWPNAIHPYVGDTKPYMCVSNTKNFYNINYGIPVGYWTADWREYMFDEPHPSTRIKRPSQCVFLSEKGGGGGTPYILSGQYYAMWGEHNGGANAGYVDGHVQWWKVQIGDIGHGWPSGHPSDLIYQTHLVYEAFGHWND